MTRLRKPNRLATAAQTPLRAAQLRTPNLRTIGPGSVASLLKIALDVAYVLMILVTGLLLLLWVASIFIPIDNLNVTVSVGVAATMGADDTPEALLKRADEGVYEAKASGRNKVVARAA